MWHLNDVDLRVTNTLISPRHNLSFDPHLFAGVFQRIENNSIFGEKKMKDKFALVSIGDQLSQSIHVHKQWFLLCRMHYLHYRVSHQINWIQFVYISGSD